MSKLRIAVTGAAVVLTIMPVRAQSMGEVLKRAADYVADFHQQLSGIVAEETYTQEIINVGRFTNSIAARQRRTLKSDLLLVRPPNADRYVELRDVFEVDNAAVRDRQARLEQLLNDPSSSTTAQISAIIEASARYNIGSITRNVNTPLMALQFLDAASQSRFSFKHVEGKAPVFADKRDAALNDAPVFRTSTEMWNVEYRERVHNTIIRKPDGGDQPARGRFWINPATGAVLISELVIDGGGVTATITVSYQSEPLMGFLVPVEMREVYTHNGERITGLAEYGRFRPIQ